MVAHQTVHTALTPAAPDKPAAGRRRSWLQPGRVLRSLANLLVAALLAHGAGAAATASQAGAAPSDTAYPLHTVRLVYDLYYGKTRTRVGEVVQTWQADGGRYVAESRAEAVGLAAIFMRGDYIQRSEGLLRPEGLVPLRFTVQDRGKTETEEARFDWETGVLHFSREGRQKEVPLPPGTQDVLSAVHQLYFLQPLPPSMELHVATARRLRPMRFEYVGEETLETAIGPRRVLHVKRQETNGALTEVWLDMERMLVPLRVYSINRNGHVLDQVFREGTVNDRALAASGGAAQPASARAASSAK